MGFMADQEQSVEQIFGAALDLPTEQRTAFLDRACKDAPEVRALVEHLLHEDEQLGSFLNTPVLQDAGRSSTFTAKTASGTLYPLHTNSAAEPSRFQTGEMIAERFLIERFIARGGMGEVYEAHDQYLQGELVAVKIIRPEIAADASNLHRFEQEVILARKLTHPNLCPIYEIFRCEEPGPPFLFLTMKLLRGETLDVRLRTHQPLPAEEAVEICTQLVRGVAAMHGAEVVHRDLKPNNVMLERTPHGLHVSIMDFGLARIHEAEVTVLKPGMVAGTPGYLAPELLRGQLPSKASDLFALGVVLHQVLTGARPHVSADGFSMRPTSSLRLASVPPAFLQATEAFLADDPERRCRAFEELHGLTSVHSISQRPGPMLSRRQLLYGAGALGCAAVVGSVWKREQIYDLMHPLPKKRFVALLTWPPVADAAIKPVLNGVIDAIASELARVEAFDHNFFVIAQRYVTDVTTSAELNDVRESLGANLVLGVFGTRSPNGYLQVNLEVLEPASSRSLRQHAIHVSPDQQFSLPERAVQVAAELLGVAKFEPNNRRTVVGTDNPEALAAFQDAESLRKEPNDTGLDRAIEQYKQALDIDPRYALAQARLSWAYLRSYKTEGNPAALSLAKANCEQAVSLDPNLVQGHLALAWVMQESGDPDGAVREIGRALSLDPSNASTLVNQADIYAASNRAREAEDTFRRALKLRPNDWVVHNDFGSFLLDHGQYKEALSELQDASYAAPKNSLPLSNVGLVYLALGRLDEASDAFQKSFALAANSYAATGLASVARIRKRYADAIGYAQTAAKLEAASSLNWLELGDAYAATGRMEREALVAYRKGAEAEQVELQTQAMNADAWMLVALCRAKEGKTAIADELLKKARSPGMALRSGDIPSQLIEIRTLELVGRRDEALAAVQAALTNGATRFQLDTQPDLEKLRSDSRYRSLVSLAPSQAGPAI